MSNKYKKELGNWGELLLDEWMNQKNWRSTNKNLRIKKGEIDRIYFHLNKQTKKNSFCLAEVKTSQLYKKDTLSCLFTETGVKKYLKQRQIKNLYRCGENLIAKLKEYGINNFQIYLRLFIIVKYFPFLGHIGINEIKNPPSIKLCYKGADYFIFSVEPEFTNINARKSLLQIKF